MRYGMINKSKIIDMLLFVANSQSSNMCFGIPTQQSEMIIVARISIVESNAAGYQTRILLLFGVKRRKAGNFFRILFQLIKSTCAPSSRYDFGTCVTQ